MSKIDSITNHPLFLNLDSRNRNFIEDKAVPYHLTFQDLNKLLTIATDFEMWDSGFLDEHWDESHTENLQGKNRKQKILNRIQNKWQQFKQELADYQACNTIAEAEPADIVFKTKYDTATVLGNCPVFSEKTRCCNLQTLDAVINCGYACSYCSIQSFYHNDEIVFHANFKDKLSKIILDPQRTYHIGTGQSSDSLLWGNREDVLSDLFAWVKNKPNVILELKTKSANIAYLLENPVPNNVIVTWSVNADSIIQNEEHRTAPLKSRLAAAKKIADKGILVGFHLHPIVAFKGWQQEYSNLADKLISEFDPANVALVSLGTLTFIKPVLKQIRQRKLKSKILQMPLQQAAGKVSYPLELKKTFFQYIYEKFTPWHKQVFFYLCMEDSKLWLDIFGFEYASNNEFEKAMKAAYLKKVNQQAPQN